MPARLVQLEDGRETGTFPLPDAPFRIGRDPDAELSVRASAVSRQHARIEPSQDGHVLVDLGTPNGTTKNGEPVRGRTPLRSGDLVVLAGEVTLRYERPWRPSTRRLLAAAALAVALAAAALLLRPEPPPDPAWQEAQGLARTAVEAWRGEEPVLARARLRSAVGVLYKAGLLDDVERRQVFDVGLERLGSRLEPPLDLLVLYRRVSRETETAAAVPERPPCRLEGAEPAALAPCLEAVIGWVFVRLHQSPDDIPPVFVHQVGATLRAERGFLSRSLKRGEPLVPMLVVELERAHMPGLLHYVALIESGYRPAARSRAGALGLWQFMPATARDYDLRVGAGVDERTDPLLSTRAAATYLQHLVFEFGSDSLVLALAGYNYGQNRVRWALKQLEDPFSDRSYWRLVERELLPPETAAYVARFTAAAVAGEAGLPHTDALRAAGY